jgi:hypothetical protein
LIICRIFGQLRRRKNGDFCKVKVLILNLLNTTIVNFQTSWRYYKNFEKSLKFRKVFENKMEIFGPDFLIFGLEKAKITGRIKILSRKRLGLEETITQHLERVARAA